MIVLMKMLDFIVTRGRITAILITFNQKFKRVIEKYQYECVKKKLIHTRSRKRTQFNFDTTSNDENT